MTLLNPSRVDDITAQAREVDVRRVLLTLVASVFYSVGWLVGAAVRSLTFTIAAVRLGYREGRTRPAGTRGRGANT